MENEATRLTHTGAQIDAAVDALANKADKSATVSNVAYDTTNKKITETINGSTSDVVTIETIASDVGENITAISTGANLDNYKTSGDYGIANATTAAGISNVPVEAGGHLIVRPAVSNAGNRLQIFITYQVSPALYIRRYNGTSWNGWVQFISSSAAVSVYSGSTAPSSSTGNNGDIYIQT